MSPKRAVQESVLQVNSQARTAFLVLSLAITLLLVGQLTKIDRIAPEWCLYPGKQAQGLVTRVSFGESCQWVQTPVVWIAHVSGGLKIRFEVRTGKELWHGAPADFP